MKMKKLTALALAGVLCLGMSTTAFAAASPLPEDAVTAKDNEGNKVDVEQSPIDTTGYDPVYGYTFADWGSKDPEKVDDSVRNTLDDRLDEIKRKLRNQEDLSQKDVKKLQAEQAQLNNLLASTDQFVVGALADVKVPAGTNFDEIDKLTVRFNLNGAWDGIANDTKVNILHAITDEYDRIVAWEVLEGLPIQKDTKGNIYVEGKFGSLSPVAILRVSDTVIDEPVIDPGTGAGTGTIPGDGSTLTPDANGNITADQLADLIVRRLQQSADTTVVRLVSGKASPKTGE